MRKNGCCASNAAKLELMSEGSGDTGYWTLNITSLHPHSTRTRSTKSASGLLLLWMWAVGEDVCVVAGVLRSRVGI
jgi:membrane protein YqaA with SNARE-associated domain